MDPAESLVNAYFHSKGYFTMPNIKLGLREIDILAFHPVSRDSVHAEVHISLEPLGKIRPWSPLRFANRPLDWRVKALCNHNFTGDVDKKTGRVKNRKIQNAVSTIFDRSDYKKQFIVGRIHEDDPPAEVENEFKRNGVTLVRFDDVVRELESVRTGVHMDEARRYLELLRAFGGPREEE